MKTKFAGHQKFPLRHGWLYKAVNYINNGGILSNANSELTEAAITSLGIGKNMITSMHYWANVVGFIERDDEGEKISNIGKMIFDRDVGYDPYLEDIGTIWLIHFLLNFNDDHLTAYRHFFNFSNVNTFKLEKYITDVESDVSRLLGKQNAGSINTITNDVMCLIATYSTKTSKVVTDDSFTSPLSELKLITDNKDGFFQCSIGDKPTLPLDIFLYALVRFTNKTNAESGATTISFADVLHNPLSPGKIFKLDEASLGRMLDRVVTERSTDDVSWSDSLGLKQVSIDHSLTNNPEQLLHDYFSKDGQQ